jgi:hypothetical protein
VTLTPNLSKGHHASLSTFKRACMDLESTYLGKLTKGRGNFEFTIIKI